MSKLDRLRTQYPLEDAHLYEQLIEFMRSVPLEESSLISILHFTQDLFGYIPESAMLLIAEGLHIPSSKVYGVVTFYSYFSLKPKGKYNFSVCMGTACYVKGANDVLAALQDELKIQDGETTTDGIFSIQATRCLGDCASAPIVMVNDASYGHVDTSSIREIVRNYRKKASAETVQSGQPTQSGRTGQSAQSGKVEVHVEA